jgi:hypothetical protein
MNITRTKDGYIRIPVNRIELAEVLYNVVVYPVRKVVQICTTGVRCASTTTRRPT